MNGNNFSEPLDATVVDLFDGWAARTPDRIAAEWQGETLTYGELRNASLLVSQALLSAGVLPHAKVPLLTQMSLEMLPAVIGILRIGACYVPIDVAVWSRLRVEAALLELSYPVAIVTTTCPGLQLPVVTVNFQKEWLRSPLADANELCERLDVLRSEFRADYLAWVVFTSGTTGKPKGVMVYHTAIYAVAITDYRADLEADMRRGIRCLLAFSIAFDGCAGVVWTTLTKGGTLAMASSSNFPEIAAGCGLLHLTPSMLAILDPSGPYHGVRYIFLGAEAPKLDVVRQWINPNRKVFNTYGPSETTCIISYGELKPDEEPPFGDLIPGVQIALVDENLQECDYGEVMIAGPGLAAGYLNNPEMTAKKFIQWNCKRFYRTGDLARRTKNGQFVWAGRADSLVKNRGFLINLETEVEPAMLSFGPVQSAVAIKWLDTLVGFVQPATVDTGELHESMKKRFDHFVVPDQILAMDSFPLNVNGKTDRRALEAELKERVSHDGKTFVPSGHSTSTYDALCMAFSVCLPVKFQELGRDSSFTRLGGNSLAAIRLSNVLRKQGHLISVIKILKLDTIGLLEKSLTSRSNLDNPERDGNDLGNFGEVPVTDVQRAMLTRSMKNPTMYGLISTIKYAGEPSAIPTARQFHDACVKAVSAHSIFHTRFNLINFTLSDLSSQRDVDWHEVSVEEAEFENACVVAEENAWLDLQEVARSEIEIPYFHVTCVSAPSKALAFVMRVHHVLMDIFSSAILLQGVERALAGKEVPQGPRYQDYARFMHKYKQDNLERATIFFEN
ncbi:NRPS, partial [Arthroderma sp. PD_2]